MKIDRDYDFYYGEKLTVQMISMPHFMKKNKNDIKKLRQIYNNDRGQKIAVVGISTYIMTTEGQITLLVNRIDSLVPTLCINSDFS